MTKLRQCCYDKSTDCITEGFYVPSSFHNGYLGFDFFFVIMNKIKGHNY